MLHFNHKQLEKQAQIYQLAPAHFSDIQASLSNRTVGKALLEPFVCFQGKSNAHLIGTLVQNEEAN